MDGRKQRRHAQGSSKKFLRAPTPLGNEDFGLPSLGQSHMGNGTIRGRIYDRFTVYQCTRLRSIP